MSTFFVINSNLKKAVYSCFFALFCFPLASLAGDGKATVLDEPGQKEVEAIISKLKLTLEKKMPTLPVSSIESSPIKGLFDVGLSTGEWVLVDETGDYLIFGGQVLKVNGPGDMVNLTAEKLAASRVGILAGLDDKDMVIYKADGEKPKEYLYVFTDVDCGYCQKFHQEIPELTKNGVEVRYLAWPRAGLNSATGKKMVQVWCADDQLTAMNQAKTRTKISSEKTCDTPITGHMQAGMKMGVSGTPAIFLSSGRQVGGYRSAKDLLSEIKP